MARSARVVIPHYPHHVTQRGSRRQTTFFNEQDYRTYLNFLAEYKSKFNIEIWAYCLMPNHVHIVAVPKTEEGLSKCMGRTHRRYAIHVNKRNRWQGHLWQERFYSCVMSESHLRLGVRYVEMNPVRAGLCANPSDWKWSSARVHLENKPNTVLDANPLLDEFPDWAEYLATDLNAEELNELRTHTHTGRPVGNDQFLCKLERITGNRLRKSLPGRKPNKTT